MQAIRAANIGVFSKKAEAYDADLVTYITGLATPLSSEQLTLLNTFIVNLKAGFGITSLSEVFDAMYVLAGETEESSLRNLVKRSSDATKINAIPFVQYEGFTGDGISMYLKTNFIPSTQGVNFKQSDCAWGFYVRNERAASLNKVSGSKAGAVLYLYPNRASGNAAALVNTAVARCYAAVTNTKGFIHGMRDNASTHFCVKNKTKGTPTTSASTALSNVEITLCSLAASNYDDIQVAFAYFSRCLTQTDINNLVDRVEEYLDYRGKGVL